LARQKSFDETKALEAAMGCFWERGFAATSLRDLTGRMGIAGPSLYNAFGDKRALYEKALDHYCRTATYKLIARIEEQHAPAERIAELFATVVDLAATDRKRRGCLLINSALEVAPHDAEMRRVITLHLGAVRSFFARSLTDARRGRSRRPTLPSQEAADNLMAVLIGLRVLARSAPERAMLESIVAAALKPLGLAEAWQRRRRVPANPAGPMKRRRVPGQQLVKRK
jgi:TetR/AcrR family transcriptional repressor of nem operon